MADPTTANLGLIVPNTGADVGAWGTAVINVNMTALDGYQGGVLNLSLGAATTITLTTASATLTPSAGPYQSANSIIELSGTLTGNQILQVAQSGVYRFLNSCTVGTNYVQIKPASGTGNAVGLPDGEQWQVHFDGTHCRLVGLPHVGQLIDMCVATTPAWMNAFTNAAYLLCNGATYSVATFPTLAAKLGSTFGGNGVTTFGVPDHQNRYFIPMDFGSNNRITSGVAGIDGTAFGAAGGDQRPQAHTHVATTTLTDPGHGHLISEQNTGAAGGPGGLVGNVGASYVTNGLNGSPIIQSSTTSISITASNATTFAGASGNIPPGLVGGMRFIKT